MNIASVKQKVSEVARKVWFPVSSSVRFIAGKLSKYKRPIGIGLSVFAILAIVVYAFLPAPHAEGALKGRRVEIFRNAEMRVSFDQKMDHASVERSWKITPAVRMDVRWEENMVIFKSAEPLEKGKDYELEISDSARNAYGKRLAETFRQTFAVLDYPEVATAIPSDNTVVRRTQTITVLFDHPIRVLSVKDVPPEVMKIEPAVKGAFHWLGTSGFEFVPSEDLAPATTYTATVPKGTKMADGGMTVEDYTWKFSTDPVTAYSSYEYGNQRIKPSEPVDVSFNYKISLELLRNALEVREGDRTLGRGEYVVTQDPKDPMVFSVRKNGGYALGTVYQFRLPKGFTGNAGPNGLPQDWTTRVQTFDLNLVITREQGTMSASTYEQSNFIQFNNPIPAKIPAGWVNVSPALENMKISSGVEDWYSGQQETTYIRIDGSWKPSTTYTITLSDAVSDIFGQHLGARTLTVNVEPYRPSVSFSAYASNGVMAAQLPHVYQMRSINAPGEWKATVCSGSSFQYVTDSSACDIKGQKTYRTDGDLNRYKINDVDLDDIVGKPLAVGFYRVMLEPQTLAPTTTWSYRTEGWETQVRNVAVIDTVLTLKRDNLGNLLVWATDAKTGNPVGGLSVEAFRIAYDRGSSQYKAESNAKGVTDNDGLITLKVGDVQDHPRFYVVAESKAHLGVAFTDWSDGISPWNYGLTDQWTSQTDALIGYVYTDRKLYRSDHLVQFKGIIRQDRDAELLIPKAREVDVTITDANGETASTQKVGVSPYGTFWGSFQLDVSRPLGTYDVCVTASEAKGSVCGQFEVREYRRPDFKVDIGVPQGLVIAGPQAEIKIHGEYYHGAPLANAKASYTITRTPSYFSPPDLWTEWYNYSLDDGRSYCYWYCRSNDNAENVANGDVTLDAQGNAVVRIPTQAGSNLSPMDYAVTVTVEDLNARSVSGNTSFTAHPADLYTGIRSNYDNGWGNPDAVFDLITVGADGSVRANVPVTVTLSKRVWKSVKKQGPAGEDRWESAAEDTTVTSKQLTTDAKGKGYVSFGAQENGLYVAKVEAKDSAGRQVAASVERYVYRYESGRGYGTSWYGYGVTDDRQMKILQTKAEYQPGETAELAVQSPYDSAKALVTVERDSIRSVSVVTLDAAHPTVSIPLGDDAIPNVYVSVLAVKGGGDKDTPDFKLGYAQLQVGTSKKMLDMSVTADKAEYRPGDTATLTVKAAALDGKPLQAEASIAVVDERVVDLMGPIDKDVLRRFYFPRNLGVGTSQSLIMLVKKVFFDTPFGGDGKGGGGASPIRGNFLDTAYWKADVITGADGMATVQVKLPDNLTNWEVLMIGTTKDTIVGSAETSFKTRKTLMVEPTLPRIVRVGDVLTVGGMIQNGTSNALDVTARLDVTSVKLLSGAAEQRVTVPANGRLPVRWQISVPEGDGANKANFTMRVSGGGLDDGVTMDVPILPAVLPTILGTSGILDQTVTERLEIPQDASKTLGDLTVTVTPSLGEGLTGSVEYLLNYEYGCAEQTTSAMLASVAYAELAKANIITASPEALKKAEDKVKGAVAKLRGMQAESGGFGFWDSSGAQYPHLTAYVFWGLTRARQAGFEIDENMLSRADQNLRDYLGSYAQGRWDNLSEDETAQALFALSERNPNGLDGYAQSVYEKRSSMSSFGRAFLALAISNIERSSSARVSTLADEVKSHIIVLERFGAYVDDGSGYDYYMSSPVRSTAIALMMYQRVNPQDQMNERLMRWLLSQKRGGYWESTQATAMGLLALTDFAKHNPVDTGKRAVDIFVDSVRKATFNFAEGDRSAGQSYRADFPQLAASANSHEVGIEKDGGNRAFYDVTLKTYRSFEQQLPVENGFTILTGIYALDDAKNEHPLQSVMQGQNVRVHMKILVPKKHQYVAAEYHLPAGLEAVDFTLSTSPKNIAGKTKNCMPNWWGDGQDFCYEDWEMYYWWGNVWKHTELRDDRIFLFAESLEPGVYEYDTVAQAVSAGTFHTPSSLVYEFYHPEVRGTTTAGMFTVKEK
jgi:alpha-2-macroglobulin